MGQRKIDCNYWYHFAERLAEKMDFKEGTKILDVGTGSAATCLIAAAKRIGVKGNFTGIDLTNETLAKAAESINNEGINNVVLECANIRDVKYPDNTFDNIVCGFIGFSDEFDFDNHQYFKTNTKMEQIYRILKKGGKAGFTTWLSQGDIKAAIDLLKEYLTHEKLMTPEDQKKIAVSYSKESVAGFIQIMADSGFQSVDIHSEDFTIVYKDLDEWWDVMKWAAWALRYTIGEKSGRPESLMGDFKEKMLPKGLEKYKCDDGYCFTKSVIFALGEK
ncbi:MAG: SAM-dependent methyltransferase [Candidatus Heimdallarchaeota archaeon]